MKAITLHSHGGLDKLVYGDVPDPQPQPREVVVLLHAVGVNHVDIDVRNGLAGIESIQTLPHVPGV
jgi:NADPH:quinone reductase-like Zn-dependent oxidoreductase